MNILLVNLHSFHNAGDAALTVEAIRQLKASFPGSRITLVMNDAASYTGEERVLESFINWFKVTHPDRTQSWRLWTFPWFGLHLLIVVLTYRLSGRRIFSFLPLARRELLEAYFDADVVVSCAGGFLYSSGRVGLTFLLSILTMGLAVAFDKPLYILPQSIGSLKRGWERRLTKWITSRARVVMVRERQSLEELNAIGLEPSHCYHFPDLAFGFEGVPKKEAMTWLRARGIFPGREHPLLGITAINWGAQNINFTGQQRYEEALAVAARFFIEHYAGKVLLFSQVVGPTVDQDDRIPAKRVWEQMREIRNHVLLVEQPLPPDMLKTLFGVMDVFIGTRMHSLVFALSEGVPCLGIGYQFKSRGVAREIGWDPWVVEIQDVTGECLTDMLGDLWTMRNALRESISQRLPQIAKEVKRAGEIIAADYRAFKGGR
ncbi:MAG: polysaccharide pyruvyl transferase family protein [Chloroflexota bacterium]